MLNPCISLQVTLVLPSIQKAFGMGGLYVGFAAVRIRSMWPSVHPSTFQPSLGGVHLWTALQT